jgi:hypothetical protein
MGAVESSAEYLPHLVETIAAAIREERQRTENFREAWMKCRAARAVVLRDAASAVYAAGPKEGPLAIVTQGFADAVLALIDKQVPTHRHVKRGTLYEVVGYGLAQTTDVIIDDEHVVIYRSVGGDRDGSLWIRPTTEFEDGRFEKLEPTP